MKIYLNTIKNIIYPKPIRCVVCNNYILHGNEGFLCDNCMDKLLSSKNKSYYSYIVENDSLSIRQESNLNNAHIICLYPYESIMQKLIKDLKFKYNIDLAYFIADNISIDISSLSIDAIVPLTSSRFSLNERGFNQIEAIADQLSKILNIPILNCLERTKHIRHQLGLSKEERFQNVKDTFTCSNAFSNKKLMLLDDVLTSGATTFFARKALIDSDAEVIVCTICKA